MAVAGSCACGVLWLQGEWRWREKKILFCVAVLCCKAAKIWEHMHFCRFWGCFFPLTKKEATSPSKHVKTKDY